MTKKKADTSTPASRDRKIGWVLIGLLVVGGLLVALLSSGTQEVPPPATAEPAAATETVAATAPGETEVPTEEMKATITVAAPLTDGQMRAAMGFDQSGVTPVFTGVDWDPVKWNWQASGLNVTTTLTLTQEWMATATMADETVVNWYGTPEGVTIVVKGFTLRQISAYPPDHVARTPCEQYRVDREFGLNRDPQYETYTGNFDCPNGVKYVPATP